MLISPEYKAGNRAVHDRQPMWGSSAPRWIPDVILHGDLLGAESILDYGCGKGHLRMRLPTRDVREYDPGIPGKDGPPEPADMVACLDVLEHVEPECLDDVLRHIAQLSRLGALLAIALYPSGTILPDGRNSHLIVESPDWWIDRIRAVWTFPMEMTWDHVPRPSRKPKGKSVLVVRMKTC